MYFKVQAMRSWVWSNMLLPLLGGCFRWVCITANCTTTWACAVSTLSSTIWLCPRSRGLWLWWPMTKSRQMSGTTLDMLLWWVSSLRKKKIPEGFVIWFHPSILYDVSSLTNQMMIYRTHKRRLRLCVVFTGHRGLDLGISVFQTDSSFQ